MHGRTRSPDGVGTTKDGKPITPFGEIGTILVNDEGKITHFEFWDDTLNLEATMIEPRGHNEGNYRQNTD